MSKMKEGGLFGLLAGLGYNVFKQVQRQESDPDYEFDYEEMVTDVCKGGLLGVAGGGILDAVDPDDPDAPALSRTAFLRYVLQSHETHNFRAATLYQQKGREMKGLLMEKFHGKIHPPETSGSMRKGLGNGDQGDMDIILPFRKDLGYKPKDVYALVFEYFEEFANEDDTIVTIRNQRKSIGIEVELDDEYLWFDIVPGVEVGNYNIDGELLLYVAALYPDEEESSLNTNLRKQSSQLMGDSIIRNIVRLLKIWRDAHEIDLSSYFLECATRAAFHSNEKNIPRTLFRQLKMTVKFLVDRIEDLRLVDPGNISNVVTEDLDPRDRHFLKESFFEMLEDIEADWHNLEYYFPPRS